MVGAATSAAAIMVGETTTILMRDGKTSATPIMDRGTATNHVTSYTFDCPNVILGFFFIFITTLKSNT
jgi:hypothetical protein